MKIYTGTKESKAAETTGTQGDKKAAKKGGKQAAAGADKE